MGTGREMRPCLEWRWSLLWLARAYLLSGTPPWKMGGLQSPIDSGSNAHISFPVRKDRIYPEEESHRDSSHRSTEWLFEEE